MEEILSFFKTKRVSPQPWGAFHLFCLGVLAVCAVLIVAFAKRLRKNPRTVRRITAGTGILLLVLETAKQLLYGFNVGTEGIYWDYPWWIFPLQMCSTPLYVCIALLFCPEGRVRRALCAYLGTFGMFGGIVVMLLPGTVFTEFIFVNLHTMLWHIALVALGMLQWCGGTIQKRTDFIGCAALFVCFAGIAAVLDCALPLLAEEGFNLFYLSPYIPVSTSQFVQHFWESVPYPVYILTYFIGFTGISAAIFFCSRAILTAAARARQNVQGSGAYSG